MDPSGRLLHNVTTGEKPKSVLVDICIETLLGAQYVFPGVSRDALSKILPESGRTPEGQPALQLVNANFAVLSVPFHVVKRVWSEGKVIWQCNA